MSDLVHREEDLGRPSAFVGLCADCIHSRRIDSDRNTTFYLCTLSARDPSFAKYPRLPVTQCPGYEPPRK